MLIKTVKREIEQKEQIEKLATSLQSANEKLKVLDKMKSEFVSIASHQLRSPLTSIRGYASMLGEGSYGKLTAKGQEVVERISESAKYMALSVEDYLNVSRIEAGNMKYEMSDFNLKEIAEKLVDELRPVALKKGLVIVFRSDCDGSCSVHADIGKTRQVIMNILDNSMKYTPKGTITVVAHDDPKKKKMYVTIQDTGVGMSKETQEEVFEKFVRAKNANNVNVTGTGLGLFVAKKMVTDMGGRVWAESEGEGQGSSFNIELPLLAGKATAR
jgi:signal transduction histidine kinase